MAPTTMDAGGRQPHRSTTSALISKPTRNDLDEDANGKKAEHESSSSPSTEGELSFEALLSVPLDLLLGFHHQPTAGPPRKIRRRNQAQPPARLPLLKGEALALLRVRLVASELDVLAEIGARASLRSYETRRLIESVLSLQKRRGGSGSGGNSESSSSVDAMILHTRALLPLLAVHGDLAVGTAPGRSGATLRYVRDRMDELLIELRDLADAHLRPSAEQNLSVAEQLEDVWLLEATTEEEGEDTTENADGGNGDGDNGNGRGDNGGGRKRKRTRLPSTADGHVALARGKRLAGEIEEAVAGRIDVVLRMGSSTPTALRPGPADGTLDGATTGGVGRRGDVSESVTRDDNDDDNGSPPLDSLVPMERFCRRLRRDVMGEDEAVVDDDNDDDDHEDDGDGGKVKGKGEEKEVPPSRPPTAADGETSSSKADQVGGAEASLIALSRRGGVDDSSSSPAKVTAKAKEERPAAEGAANGVGGMNGSSEHRARSAAERGKDDESDDEEQASMHPAVTESQHHAASALLAVLGSAAGN